MASVLTRAIVVVLCVFSLAPAPKSESTPDDPQRLIEIIDERSTSNTFSLVAVSKVDYPVTANIELSTLENLKATTPGPYSIVVQPKKRTLITKIQRINARAATRYGTTFSCYAGWRDEKPQDKYVYTLPWEPGYAYPVGQGFNGQFSHQGKEAVDFIMPEGATICAARDGVVIEARDEFSEGGTKDEFKDKANRVLIMHPDGTLGRYAHFVHKGVKVKVGQKVKAGDVIGLCGATGYAQGPHLHFEVNRPPKPGENAYDTIAMKFLATDEHGKEAPTEPKEGVTLQRGAGGGGGGGGSAGVRKTPTNLIEKIVLCERLDMEGQPIGINDVFRGDAGMTIMLHFGATGERTLKVTISKASEGDKAQPLYQQDVQIKARYQIAWTSVDLAQESHLRGSLVLRVWFNDQQVGEKRFRVQ